jgi:hypothetical protein
MKSLAASAAAYVVAIIVVRTDDPDITRGHSVAKVILWIVPIFLEMGVHIYVNKDMQCQVPDAEKKAIDKLTGVSFERRRNWLLEEANEIITRADTVFLILLGAGECSEPGSVINGSYYGPNRRSRQDHRRLPANRGEC